LYHVGEPGHTAGMSSSSGETLPTPAVRRPSADTGKILGDRYTLHEVRGTGGFATVFRATDRVLDAPVAVKLANEVPSLQDCQRFDAEARLAARLQHPNIIRVMDYGDHEGRPFSVMPLLQGRVLRDHRGSHWYTISRLMQQLCAAIRALHEQVAFNDEGHRTRVLHRDIKPANCFVSDRPGLEPHLTLLDLGLCKWMGDSVHTTRGRIVGSTAYMAPECIVGIEASVRSEVYSLGVTFYELLTGELPYGDDFTAAVRVMQDPASRAPSPRERQSDIPESLAALVMRAMAPHMPERFTSVAVMMTALDRVIGRVPPQRTTAAPGTVAPVIPLRPLELVQQAVPEVATPPAPTAAPPRAPRIRRLWPLALITSGLGVLALTLTRDLAREPTSSPTDHELPAPPLEPAPAALPTVDTPPAEPIAVDTPIMIGPEPPPKPLQRAPRPTTIAAVPTDPEAAARTAIPALRACPHPPASFFAQLRVADGHASLLALDGSPVNDALSWHACSRRALEAVQYPPDTPPTLRIRLILAAR
jgi:eukaryotic-like serine/threonine-protein kinase